VGVEPPGHIRPCPGWPAPLRLSERAVADVVDAQSTMGALRRYLLHAKASAAAVNHPRHGADDDPRQLSGQQQAPVRPVPVGRRYPSPAIRGQAGGVPRGQSGRDLRDGESVAARVRLASRQAATSPSCVSQAVKRFLKIYGFPNDQLPVPRSLRSPCDGAGLPPPSRGTRSFCYDPSGCGSLVRAAKAAATSWMLART
jgi:hypothetical protein